MLQMMIRALVLVGSLVAAAAIGPYPQASATGLPAVTAPVGRQLYAEPSPLGVLVDRLAELSAEARLDLAALLVESLAAAYEAELELARRENPTTASGQRRLGSWYQATAWTLGEIRRAQAALHAARELQIHIDTRDDIMLVIDGHPLLLAWPRPATQAHRETAVAREFCRLHRCPDADHTSTAPEAIQGAWVFEQLRPPTWQSSEGIRCEFNALAGRGENERTCRALVIDMQSLAAALAVATRRGEHIDWMHLALRGAENGARHGITVNARGDYITAHLPALSDQPVDWNEARTWLEARLQGRTAEATIRRAGPR